MHISGFRLQIQSRQQNKPSLLSLIIQYLILLLLNYTMTYVHPFLPFWLVILVWYYSNPIFYKTGNYRRCFISSVWLLFTLQKKVLKNVLISSVSLNIFFISNITKWSIEWKLRKMYVLLWPINCKRWVFFFLFTDKVYFMFCNLSALLQVESTDNL